MQVQIKREIRPLAYQITVARDPLSREPTALTIVHPYDQEVVVYSLDGPTRDRLLTELTGGIALAGANDIPQWEGSD